MARVGRAESPAGRWSEAGRSRRVHVHYRPVGGRRTRPWPGGWAPPPGCA